MQPRYLLLYAAVGAAVVAALAIGVDVSGGILESATAPPRVVAEGDELGVHIRIYDAAARLLWSTAAADKAELEAIAAASAEPFVVPSLDKDAPSRAEVVRGAGPTRLDNTSSYVLGDQLVGKQLGDRVVAPVLGTFQGYTETVRLDRLRGPFPATMSANESIVDKIAAADEKGQVWLDDLVPIHIVERAGGRATIAVDVAAGEQIAVRQAGFTATVLREEGEDSFRLLLDAEEGDTFSLMKPCKFARYVLPTGSYRVESVTPEELVLARSPTRWPQLIERPIVMVLEIHEILDKE